MLYTWGSNGQQSTSDGFLYWARVRIKDLRYTQDTCNEDRVFILKQKTLALLNRGGVDPSRIYVFADPRLFNTCTKELEFFGIAVAQSEGICGQWNKIVRYFAELGVSHNTGLTTTSKILHS